MSSSRALISRRLGSSCSLLASIDSSTSMFSRPPCWIFSDFLVRPRLSRDHFFYFFWAAFTLKKVDYFVRESDSVFT